jgi:hypothetical protein
MSVRSPNKYYKTAANLFHKIGAPVARNARDFYVKHTNNTKKNLAIVGKKLHNNLKRKSVKAAQAAAIKYALKMTKVLANMDKSQQISYKSKK